MSDPAPWVSLPPHLWSFARFRAEIQRLAERGEIEEAHALAEAYARPIKIQEMKEESHERTAI